VYRPKIVLPIFATIDQGNPVVANPALVPDFGATLAANPGEFKEHPNPHPRGYRAVTIFTNPFGQGSHFLEAQYLERLVYFRFPNLVPFASFLTFPGGLPRRFFAGTFSGLMSPIQSRVTDLFSKAESMASAALTGNVIIIATSPFDDFNGCFDFLGFHQLVNAEYVLLVHA
jgi:hypothetical protein